MTTEVNLIHGKKNAHSSEEILRGVGISAQAVIIISIMIIQIILRHSMGCNSFTAWFSKTIC